MKIRSRSENRSISYRRITHQANSFFSVIDLAKKQILRETKKTFTEIMLFRERQRQTKSDKQIKKNSIGHANIQHSTHKHTIDFERQTKP